MGAQSLLVRPRRTSWSRLRWGNLALCSSLHAYATFDRWPCVEILCFVHWEYTHPLCIVFMSWFVRQIFEATVYAQHCECRKKELNLYWHPLSRHWLLHVGAESPQWHTGGEALAWLAALTGSLLLTGSLCLCERPCQLLAGIESRCTLTSVGHQIVLNSACNNMTAVMLWLALLLVIMAWVVQSSQSAVMMTFFVGHVSQLQAIAIWMMFHIQSFPR